MNKISHANKIISVLCFSLCTFFISNTAQAAFAGGDGSVGAPYQIENCTQLQDMENYLSSNFVLNNDINCYDTVNWNGGAGFSDIGAIYTPYSGIFDGQHHTIDDLYLGSGRIGLFGSISGTVRNLGLVNVRVNSPANAYVGTIVGRLDGAGTLSQVFATGEVTGVSYVGGIVGWQDGGTMINVYSQAKVGPDVYNGGIVGSYDSGTMTNAYATGNGYSAGGGGVVGGDFGGTTVNTFYDGQAMSMGDTRGGATPKTTAQMKSVTTFTATSTPGLTTAWDFVGTLNNDAGTNDIWNIDPLYNGGYPYFTWQVFDQTAPTVVSITTSITDGRYVVGTVIPVTVSFSEPVTGSITVNFNTNQTCSFTLTHESSGTCSYAIQQNDRTGHLDVTISGTATDRWGNVSTNLTPTSNGIGGQSIVINPALGGAQGGGSVAEQIQYLTAMGKTEVVQELLARWPQPSVQVNTPTPVIIPPAQELAIVFKRNLTTGMSGADVKALQQYLNTNGFPVALSGAGSKGKEIDYFGPGTKKAVMAFQKKNGIVPNTGTFGPKTRAMVER